MIDTVIVSAQVGTLWYGGNPFRRGEKFSMDSDTANILSASGNVRILGGSEAEIVANKALEELKAAERELEAKQAAATAAQETLDSRRAEFAAANSSAPSEASDSDANDSDANELKTEE